MKQKLNNISRYLLALIMLVNIQLEVVQLLAVDKESIDTNKSVGQIPYQTNVSPQGALSYTVPISIPSTSSGFQPNISLTYNSMSQDRIAGMGWSIGGISAISRVNSSTYYDGKIESTLENDAFSIDGIRLIKGEKSNFLTTEQGSILVKKRFSDTGSLVGFEAFFPNGNKASYGDTINIFHITRQEDKYGNFIEYKYIRDYFQIGDLPPSPNGGDRISEIMYGANKENKHYASIKFIYDNEKRKDIGTLFHGNIPYREKHLLKEIRSYYKESIFNTYTLEHEFSSLNYATMLTKINCKVDNEQLNPLQFTYNSNKESKLEIVKAQLPSLSIKMDSSRLILPIKFFSNKSMDGFVYMPSKSTFDFYTLYSGNGNHYNTGRYPTGRSNSYNGGRRDTTERRDTIERSEIEDYAYIYKDSRDSLLCPSKVKIGGCSIKQGEKTIAGLFRGLLPIDYKGTGNKLLLRILEGSREPNRIPSFDPDPNLSTLVFDSFNSDGKLVDSFQFSFPENAITVEYRSGSKRFGAITKSFLIGDFLGDGYESVLCITHNKDYNGKTRDSRAVLIDLNKKKVIYNKTCFGIDIADIIQVVDFDGDGKSDIYHIHKIGTDVYELDSHLGFLDKRKDDTNAKYIITPNLPEVNSSTRESKDRILFADIDGDGKTDILTTETRKDGSKYWYIYYVNGIDFQVIDLSEKEEIPLAYNPDYDYLLQDVNGDGLPDFIVLDKNGQIFIHENINGKSFDLTPKTIPDKFDLNTTLVSTRISEANKLHPIMGIIDGELALVSNSNNRQENRLMKSSTNSLGIETKYQYGNLLENKVCSIDLTKDLAFPYNSFVENMYVLNKIETKYKDSAIESKTYKYDTPVLHRQGLGFRGFYKFSITDNLRDQNVVQEFDPLNYGVSTRTVSPTSEIINKYKTILSDNKSAQVLLTENVSKDKLNGIESTSSYQYDTYGNPIKQTVDYGSGIKTSTYEYINKDDPSNGIYQLGIIENQIETSTRNNQTITNKSHIDYNNIFLPISTKEYYNDHLVSESAYAYDDQFNLKESKSRKFESSVWFTTKYEYDDYGRVIKETDPFGFTTENVYDGYFLRKVIDYKGHTTQYAYDAWGRNRLVTYADGTTKSQDLKWDSSVPDALYSSLTKVTGNPDEITYYDALGRELRSGSQRFDGSFLYVDQKYDDKGRVEGTSLPFKGSSPSLWNVNSYDNYDRPTSVTYASGKKDEYSYGKLKKISIIDGVTTLKETDETGQTIRIEDASGEIVYNLRADGQPESIVAPGNVKTSFEYDKYGRQTAIDDPSAGTKTFVYDNKGNIQKETDARGKSISYVYDDFNRLLTKDIQDQFKTSYFYNSDNLLAKVSSTNGTSTEYKYDEYLRPILQKESITDGKWIESTMTYRSDGNVGRIKYTSQLGDLATENYEYVNGKHTELKINDTQSIWKLTAENDMGMPTQSQTGVVGRNYEYDQFGLPQRRALSVDNKYIQDFGYEFDALTGNLKWRKDNTRDITENFSYDILNRLTDFGDNSIEYDKKGNITQHSQIGVFAYSNAKPYAIEKVAPYGEDIPMRKQKISYNTQMRADTISENGYLAMLSYNSAGDRMKMDIKKDGQDFLKRYYIGGNYELDESLGKTTERLYLGGDAYTAAAVLIKEGTSSKLNYIGRDYLGSITHVIDATGVVIQELSYDAWGRFRDPKTHKVYRFDTEVYPVLGWRGYTGHEHLPMYGLINMNARLYDPVVGRFLSPDPYVQAPDLSQNFNRYSYALNNPLRYTDPSGEIIPFIIAGAIIGGAINLGYKALNGQINSWTDGFMAFGIGAAAGAVGTFTAGAAFVAAGGAAAGAGGFIAGAWGGVMGYISSAPMENLGNHIYFGDPLMSAEDYAIGVATAAVTSGAMNGVNAKINNKNVVTGKEIAEGRSAFAINNTPVKPKLVPSDIKNEIRLLDAPKANVPNVSIGSRVSPNIVQTEFQYSNSSMVHLGEETMHQSLMLPKQIERYTLYSTNGLVGDTYNINIFYMEAQQNSSLGGMRSLLNIFENEAVNAGANKISIYGSTVINGKLLNPNIINRLGYTYEEVGNSIIIQKTVK